MKTVAIIRDRGQLTIPDSIRKHIGWVHINSVVELDLLNPSEIIIKPHGQISEKYWEELSDLIKKTRDIKGKCRENASEFIARIREGS